MVQPCWARGTYRAIPPREEPEREPVLGAGSRFLFLRVVLGRKRRKPGRNRRRQCFFYSVRWWVRGRFWNQTTASTSISTSPPRGNSLTATQDRAGGFSANTLEYAVDYFCIFLLGSIFVEISTGLKSFINAQGRPAIAMFSVLIGALLNIILDPIFIFGFNMGVKGAALATVLSQACSAAWVLTFLFSKRASLPLEKPYMKLDRKIILSILALGVSPFIMASTESLVGFVLNSSLKEFGDIYISALTILQSAMQFASVPLTGFAQGFVPIISYNYGHGDKQRVKECFRIVLITMFSFNLLLMLFMILFPSTVASAFTSDERLIETVRWTMPVFLGGMTIFGLQRACQNMFVALGQARISIFIALLRKAILLIPLALILPHFMGVTGVYAAEAISDATAAIWCTLLFFRQFPKILGKIQGNTLRTS